MLSGDEHRFCVINELEFILSRNTLSGQNIIINSLNEKCSALFTATLKRTQLQSLVVMRRRLTPLYTETSIRLGVQRMVSHSCCAWKSIMTISCNGQTVKRRPTVASTARRTAVSRFVVREREKEP